MPDISEVAGSGVAGPDRSQESVAGLLDPHREVVDFAGRDGEIAELLGWCADGQDAPLRLVVGPSGVGKTRLAVELARQMRARGWRTSWVDAGSDGHAALTMSHRKVLLIVDHADERQDLDELLVRLTAQEPQARLLLLARSAGAWCDQLELYGRINYALISAARSELMLLPLAVRNDVTDREIAEAAAGCFAAELGLTRPARPVFATADTTRWPILDLHIAALLAAMRERGDLAGVLADARSATGELVSHEERLWILTESGPETAEAGPGWAGAGTGAAGASAAELDELGFGELTARQRVAAEYLLASASADADRAARGLPTRVADWLAAAELAAAPEFAKHCFREIEAAQAARAAAALARLGADDPPPPLDAATAMLAGELEDLDAPVPALVAVLNALPNPAAAWSKAGAALCGRIADQFGATADPAARAYWLTSLGAREWQAGRRAEAVSRTQQAVASRRELAGADPDRHLSSLAHSLGNLGHQLAGLGRVTEAISAIEEAALIYRAVAVVSPSRYLPSLAAALARLGSCYARAGRHQQAREASDEAALLRRELSGVAAQAPEDQPAR